MSGGSDIWGSVDAGTYSDLEDEDDDEDDELGPRISATIKYVELPAKYDAPRVKLVKLNEATCPGCITACRRSIALSTVSIIFLVVASFDAVLSVAVASILLVDTNATDNSSSQQLGWGVFENASTTALATTSGPMPIDPHDQLLFYSISAIFISCGFILLSFDAIIGENNLQLVAAVVTSILMTGYVIFKYFSTGILGPVWQDIRVYVLVAKLACQVLYFAVFHFVVQSFGFKDSKIIGSNENILKCYAGYKRYLAATWVDLELCIVFFLMFGLLNNNFAVTNLEAGLCAGFFVVEVLYLLWGWVCIVDERRRSMFVWYALATLQLGFVAFKLVTKATGPAVPGVSGLQFYIVGGLNVVGRVFYIAFGAACHRNFSQGLLQSFSRG